MYFFVRTGIQEINQALSLKRRNLNKYRNTMLSSYTCLLENAVKLYTQ